MSDCLNRADDNCATIILNVSATPQSYSDAIYSLIWGTQIKDCIDREMSDFQYPEYPPIKHVSNNAGMIEAHSLAEEIDFGLREIFQFS